MFRLRAGLAASLPNTGILPYVTKAGRLRPKVFLTYPILILEVETLKP